MMTCVYTIDHRLHQYYVDSRTATLCVLIVATTIISSVMNIWPFLTNVKGASYVSSLTSPAVWCQNTSFNFAEKKCCQMTTPKEPLFSLSLRIANVKFLLLKTLSFTKSSFKKYTYKISLLSHKLQWLFWHFYIFLAEQFSS